MIYLLVTHILIMNDDFKYTSTRLLNIITKNNPEIDLFKSSTYGNK